MRNCIKADILRVQKKKSFLIMLALTLSFCLAGAIIIKALKADANAFATVCEVIGSFMGLLIGIPVFSAVLSDDFKSKSMQTAIGHGLTRNKVIFARFFEITIIIVEAFVLISIAMYIIGMAIGASGSAMGTSLGKCWIEVLRILCYAAISLIFVYAMQNGTLGLVMYILMSSGVISGILLLVDSIPFFVKHHISIMDYMPKGMIDSFANQANAMPKRIGWLIAALVCYLALPLFITMKIFKNKELDF